MNQDSELERLEQFVTKLLTQYDGLLETNAGLQRNLQAREEEIRELQGQLQQANEERGAISGRIKGLIDQIEQWQSTVVEPEESVAGEGAAEGQPEAEKREEMSLLEEADDESDAADRNDIQHLEFRGEAERESSLQRNLFNIETTQFRHNSSD